MHRTKFCIEWIALIYQYFFRFWIIGSLVSVRILFGRSVCKFTAARDSCIILVRSSLFFVCLFDVCPKYRASYWHTAAPGKCYNSYDDSSKPCDFYFSFCKFLPVAMTGGRGDVGASQNDTHTDYVGLGGLSTLMGDGKQYLDKFSLSDFEFHVILKITFQHYLFNLWIYRFKDYLFFSGYYVAPQMDQKISLSSALQLWKLKGDYVRECYSLLRP